MWEKNEFRRFVKQKRDRLSPETEALWSEKLRENLMKIEQIKKATCLFCYLSLRGEADTSGFVQWCWESGKKVAVPKVEGARLRFYLIRSKTDLETGCMGIMEPKSGCEPAAAPLAPAVVPGLAFDRQGRRIGYGKGYYDRFFSEEPGHMRIGIAYDFQLFSAIPSEAHDVPLHALVTPSEAVICS